MSYTIDWTTFEDIASQISFESIASQGHFTGSYQFGKLALINLADLKVSSQPSSTQTLASGLPTPVRNTEVILIGGTTGKPFRCNITTGGLLSCWYPSNIDLSELYYLNFVYKTQ